MTDAVESPAFYPPAAVATGDELARLLSHGDLRVRQRAQFALADKVARDVDDWVEHQRSLPAAAREHVRRYRADQEARAKGQGQPVSLDRFNGELGKNSNFTPILSDADRFQIYEGNARRVFKRLDDQLKAKGQ